MTDPMMHVRSLHDFLCRRAVDGDSSRQPYWSHQAAKAGANQAFYERQLSLLSVQIRTDRNQPSLAHSRKPISNLSNGRNRAGTGRSPGVSRMSVKSHKPLFPVPQAVATPLQTRSFEDRSKRIPTIRR